MPISPELSSLLSTRASKLLQDFEERLGHLNTFTRGVTLAWDPRPTDGPRLHNHYIDLLVTTYAAKYTSFAAIMLDGLNRLNYFAYALAARALVEMAATLRYYVETQYRPLLDSHPIDARILAIHEKHLRGTRFDWPAYIAEDYAKMAETNAKRIAGDKSIDVTGGILEKQTNVITCVEKWAKEAPVILILYELLCDLVHPNIGSTFLTSYAKDGRLFFGVAEGAPIGHMLFEQSFPWLLSVVHKGFNRYFFLLLSMKYQPDELSPLAAPDEQLGR